MATRKPTATREATNVEILEAPEERNLPAVVERRLNPIVNIGKIPGEIREALIDGNKTIRALFIEIGVRNLDNCEIQRNGRDANLDDNVEPGDTVLAIAKIRGNTELRKIALEQKKEEK